MNTDTNTNTTTISNPAILWIVEAQFDFMRNDESFAGGLPVPGAREIEPNIEMLVKEFKARKKPKVFTGDWHTMQTKEISKNPDYVNTFPVHCLVDSPGARFIPATQLHDPHTIPYIIDWRSPSYDADLVKAISSGASPRDLVMYKDHFDIFHGSPESPHAETVLNILNPSAVIIGGVAANVCVNYARVGLMRRNIKVYAVTDAIKELPGKPLDEIYEGWKAEGTRLITTAEVPALLDSLYSASSSAGLSSGNTLGGSKVDQQ